ncbi:ribokinase [Pelagibacteraceae bacterium]|nr:ribokinase [Pelagibacteraceae bacterium]
MSSKNIVVLGSLHYDIFIESDKIPEVGETVLGKKWYPKLGGKGANQAVALVKENINVNFVSAVGNDDFANYLINQLSKNNISDKFLLKNNGTSGMSVAISNNSGNYSAVVISGANLEISEKILSDDNLWKNCSFLMIQNEIKEKINIKAAIEAKKRNIRVFLNAAPAKKINDELFDLVDILLVNEIESQQLLDTKSTDFKRLAEELSNYVSKIIITLGDKGVVYFEKNKKVDHINAYSVDVKSAHGAGDYFAGKFISNFIETNDFEDSIKTANKKTSEFISSQ